MKVRQSVNNYKVVMCVDRILYNKCPINNAISRAERGLFQALRVMNSTEKNLNLSSLSTDWLPHRVEPRHIAHWLCRSQNVELVVLSFEYFSFFLMYLLPSCRHSYGLKR